MGRVAPRASRCDGRILSPPAGAPEAMAVLARAQARLRAECVAAGKRELYLELGETDGTVPREFCS